MDYLFFRTFSRHHSAKRSLSSTSILRPLLSSKLAVGDKTPPLHPNTHWGSLRLSGVEVWNGKLQHNGLRWKKKRLFTKRNRNAQNQLDATMEVRKKKRKVLLMGKSGSGKSSMRSIIFSNYVAKDVRRLGATIDVEHSHVKFMGNLTLNLWDCGGQDAFMETYLASQRENIFSDVAVLIYVFDIESREVERDLDTYHSVIEALQHYSPNAYVFCLVHKMDLIQAEHRERIYEERSSLIRGRSGSFEIGTFGSSIWDQTLYKAWAGIVHKLIPNLYVIERFLDSFAKKIEAEEVILFERSTFLTVTSVTSEIGKLNPTGDRHERLSNIMKAFKHCAARNTHTTPATAGFLVMQTKTPQFNLFLAHFTDNTYIFVVVPPGEAAYNCAVLNTMLAREAFVTSAVDGGSGDTFPLPPTDSARETAASGPSIQ